MLPVSDSSIATGRVASTFANTIISIAVILLRHKFLCGDRLTQLRGLELLMALEKAANAGFLRPRSKVWC